MARDRPRNKATDTNSLSNDLVQQMLEVQQQNISNRSAEISLQEKELEINSALAHKSLDYQKEYLSQKVPEERKKVTVYLISGFFTLLLILGFLVFCINIGHEDVAIRVFYIVAGVVTHFITFYFGRKIGEAKAATKITTPNAVEEAEVVAE